MINQMEYFSKKVFSGAIGCYIGHNHSSCPLWGKKPAQGSTDERHDHPVSGPNQEELKGWGRIGGRDGKTIQTHGSVPRVFGHNFLLTHIFLGPPGLLPTPQPPGWVPAGPAPPPRVLEKADCGRWGWRIILIIIPNN